ncbi:glycosyltransferase family 1 protein [Methanosarcina sp. MSH10X1]|uniref:glycosyltransferase family 4 protein n=1 Tax=Methanosarcina sp. MSH10X1 TaxID=2507075 RepID=UPI000FFBC8A0|nr:glycosyltransferase family 4 protein [Methanosarcina sp. MSH10X1]RXA21942.1 glycosyltransferase family 1 protein [Methanosarcina sp. MSH10X1]
MDNKNICILTFPISKSGITPLSNLVDILYLLSNNLYLITGNEGYIFFKDYKKIHAYGIDHRSGKSSIETIGKYILTQVKMSYLILKLRNKIDIYVLFFGCEGLLLPVLTIKLLKKKVISIPADYTIKFDRDKLSQTLRYLSNITRMISDRIILYSPNLITEWELSKYKNKVSIGHEHILDFNRFKLEKKYSDRELVIGYIGRFSEEKGIINFIESIPLILKEKPHLNVLIIGDGDLKNDIQMYLLRNGLENNVKLMGWICHEHLPTHLNSLKLLVLPSYIEGLPNIMLEAMACGTSVLATKVGAIPDIIIENETGFLMENNSPECIAKNVIRVLDRPDLDSVAYNARTLVNTEYTYKNAIENYKIILAGLTRLN